MRLVLDTSVIVSAFRGQYGASRALLEAFDDRRIVVIISQPLFTEYEAVLKRTESNGCPWSLASKDRRVPGDIADRAFQVGFHQRIGPQLRDPKDNMVLETAVNGGAEAIVTHNVRDFLPESSRLEMPIWTPGHTIKVRLRR